MPCAGRAFGPSAGRAGPGLGLHTAGPDRALAENNGPSVSGPGRAGPGRAWAGPGHNKNIHTKHRLLLYFF